MQREVLTCSGKETASSYRSDATGRSLEALHAKDRDTLALLTLPASLTSTQALGSSRPRISVCFIPLIILFNRLLSSPLTAWSEILHFFGDVVREIGEGHPVGRLGTRGRASLEQASSPHGQKQSQGQRLLLRVSFTPSRHSWAWRPCQACAVLQGGSNPSSLLFSVSSSPCPADPSPIHSLAQSRCQRTHQCGEHSHCPMTVPFHLILNVLKGPRGANDQTQ